MKARQTGKQGDRQQEIVIVGGGIAGLVTAISCAESGHPARVFEAHHDLGGRAYTTGPPYATNFGPHALYKDRANWRWLAQRDLLPAIEKPASRSVCFYYGGRVRQLPPAALVRIAALLGRTAPVDTDFASWAGRHCGERVASMLCAWAGAFTFDPDPGRLSAAFVWERLRWLYLPPTVRYVRGGWGQLVAGLRARAVELGVTIETESRVESMPEPPVIVATELDEARRLLGDDALAWEFPRAVLLDLALTARKGDPGAILDLDGGTLIERVTAFDSARAPEGEDLVQAHVGIPAGAPAELGVERLEGVLDAGFPHWRDRVVWRRRQLCEGRTGALDLPGHTWRERPAIDRGNGVFLAGDMVAAPGVLSEVAFESARIAADLACAWDRHATHGSAGATVPA